ncbi:hypothetical protein FJY69_06325 [candidate division WOR-3 bacterium]|nr:hypothetical protein [candidate division WOR-3 bacterium]
MGAVWTRVKAAKPQRLKTRHHNHDPQPANPFPDADRAARAEARRAVAAHKEARRRQKIEELIAMYAARGLDPEILRQVAALATDKGMRKLANGLT